MDSWSLGKLGLFVCVGVNFLIDDIHIISKGSNSDFFSSLF